MPRNPVWCLSQTSTISVRDANDRRPLKIFFYTAISQQRHASFMSKQLSDPSAWCHFAWQLPCFCVVTIRGLGRFLHTPARFSMVGCLCRGCLSRCHTQHTAACGSERSHSRCRALLTVCGTVGIRDPYSSLLCSALTCLVCRSACLSTLLGGIWNIIKVDLT